MKECSKSIARRLSDSNFIRKYFVGSGIDIGGKPDPLALYVELFPLITGCRTWDWEDGDAQFMSGVDDESYDFVFSSHCLEHMVDPLVAIENWFRILRPGGHMVLSVPDEDLYEQREFPSTFNKDHKTTWTVFKEHSWSGASRNILDVIRALGSEADIRKIEVIDSLYRYDLPRFDQTLTPVAESGIEVIVRKRTPAEVAEGARPRSQVQPPRELRLHLNQYLADQRSLRASNQSGPPFQDESEL